MGDCGWGGGRGALGYKVKGHKVEENKNNVSEQYVAVYCSVLPCVAECCSALQRVVMCCRVLQRAAICCYVLQHVAMVCHT